MLNEIVPDIFTWAWFSEPHGYNFNGHLICQAGGNLCIDPVEPTEEDLNEIVRRGVVQVPEGRKIFPSLTVLENLELGSYIAAAKARRREGLEQVFGLFPRLKERESQAAGTMSGGEQQMLAIGRALMARPRVLMLDEPSLGLAPIMVREIFRIIGEINRLGMTVLLVEQNTRQALALSQRGYVLENGRVVLEGSGAELLGNEHVRRAYLGM